MTVLNTTSARVDISAEQNVQSSGHDSSMSGAPTCNEMLRFPQGRRLMPLSGDIEIEKPFGGKALGLIG